MAACSCNSKDQSRRILSEGTADFWVRRQVKVLQSPVAADFLREGVCCYEPAIIRGVANTWPAYSKWDLAYLVDQIGSKLVDVNITPDGYGDSVKAGHFVYPLEAKIEFTVFADMLMNRHQAEDVVPYLSEQNDNLKRTLPESLLSHIPKSVALADEAFGLTGPEATNIWIGDERSVSSLHKDHFENFYAVIEGEKIFTLLPPTDIAFIKEGTFPTKRYAATLDRVVNVGKTLSARDLILTTDGCPEPSLKWIADDPDKFFDAETMQASGPYRHTHPVRCKVQAGEILYIPAMWYHRVTQTRATIAVNYWYDMRFDFRYVFYQLAKSLDDESADEDVLAP